MRILFIGLYTILLTRYTRHYITVKWLPCYLPHSDAQGHYFA